MNRRLFELSKEWKFLESHYPNSIEKITCSIGNSNTFGESFNCPYMTIPDKFEIPRGFRLQSIVYSSEVSKFYLIAHSKHPLAFFNEEGKVMYAFDCVCESEKQETMCMRCFQSHYKEKSVPYKILQAMRTLQRENKVARFNFTKNTIQIADQIPMIGEWDWVDYDSDVSSEHEQDTPLFVETEGK